MNLTVRWVIFEGFLLLDISKRPSFAKINFQGLHFLQNIFSQALAQLNCHCIVDTFLCAPIAFYRYFNLVQSSIIAKRDIIGSTALSYYQGC